MKRNSILVLALGLALSLWLGPAAAGTTTPNVPNDVGHWLNLEQRTGTLAPEIAKSPQLMHSILVVERSLAKIDAHLDAQRGEPRCIGLLLPYVRVTRETSEETDDQGQVTISIRQVRLKENLAARVCTTIELRAVLWEVDDALLILSRPRNQFGGFPKTLYALFHVSAKERAQWAQRAALGKNPKAPKLVTLYMPPNIDDPAARRKERLLAAFGPEFALPPDAFGADASKDPTDGWPPDPPRWDQ